MSASKAIVPLRETLRIKPFRRILGGTLMSNTGYWMQAVAAAFLVREWTGGDAVMVSLVQTALFLPAVLLMMPGGILADIFDRRRMLMIGQTWMMASAAAIALLVVSGVTSPWLLLGLLAFVAVGYALTTPAQSSIWPELVGIREVGNAISLYSMTNNGARLIGPAVAGAMIGAVGVAPAVALNAIAYIPILIALTAWKRTAPQAKRAPMSIREALTGAFAFAAASPPFRAILVRGGLFFIVASIVLGVFPVKVIVADDFGTVFSFFGLGAVLGALNYPRAAARFSRNGIMAAAIVLHAAGLLAASSTASVPILSALTCAIGFGWFFVMSAVQIGSQMVLPDAVRGRGLALLNLVLMSGYAFGSPLWGAVARATSPDRALQIAAGVSLAALALTFRMRLPSDAKSPT